MSEQIRVGGYWLSGIAPWGELNYSTGADGGCLAASWKMDLPPTFTHPALRRGQVVEIRTAPTNVWQGILSEPDADDDWTLNAQGLSALGHGFLCFDGALNTTSTPDTAIDQAIARGLMWKRPTSISAVPFAVSDETNALNYLTDLLDAFATSVGKRWGVDADRNLYLTADPTLPTWHLAPGSGRFGLADDDYASDVFVRYLGPGAGYATATAGDAAARAQFLPREYPVDATARGIMTSGAASALAAGLLAKGAARMGYTNGVTVTRSQLTTPGGTPSYLPFVKGGQLVRQFGVSSEQGQPLPYVDWVIGETHLQAGADSIPLTPVGLVPRVLESVLADTVSAA